MTARQLDLGALTLAKGSHNSREQGVCLLEAAAWYAGEDHGDMPACVSPVLRTFGTNLNDVLPDDRRQHLKPLIPLLIGTAGDGLDERRAYLALDWLVRTYLPAWLRLVPALTAQADLLSAAHEVRDLDSAMAIGALVREAASQSAAAWAAAGDAARDAARDAAGAAARAAAGAAARDAARDAGAAAGAAARDAAWAAARAAAWAAARDAWAAAGAAARDAARDYLQPTVDALQQSAIELYARMIDPPGVAA